jgi:hypothetical protein
MRGLRSELRSRQEERGGNGGVGWVGTWSGAMPCLDSLALYLPGKICYKCHLVKHGYFYYSHPVVCYPFRHNRA